MITVMRRYLQGAAYKIVVLIMAIILAIAFILPSFLRDLPGGGGAWALRVNGEEIGYADFRREVAEQRARINMFRMQFGQYADWILKDVNPQTLALEALTQEELINQFADRLGLYLHPDYITEQLQDFTFLSRELGTLVHPSLIDESGNLNKEHLVKYLRYEGLTVELFERKVERVLMKKIVNELIATGLYIPAFDLKQQYIVQYAAKKFAILTLSLDTFLKEEKAKKISDQELQDFFEEENKQRKRYYVPEKRSGQLWKFTPRSYGITITDEQIEEYYNNNKVKLFIEEPTKVQVRRILFKISDDTNLQLIKDKALQTRKTLLDDPTRFAAIAKELSEDKDSAKNGGLLALFAKGEKEKVFERTAFLLKEDNAISDVIQTDEGYEILQRISKNLQTYKPLKNVRREIEETLTQKKFNEHFVSDMKQILGNTDKKEREATLKQFIKEKGGKPEHIKEMVKDNSELSQTLFKLAMGETDFYVDDQTGIAVQLANIQKSYVPELATIKNTVMDDLYEKRAIDRLKKSLEQAKKDASQVSFEQLAQQLPAHLEQTAWIKPDGEKLEALKEKGMPTSVMLQIEKIGMVLAHHGERDGYLIRLDEQEAFDAVAFEDKKSEVAQALTSERITLLEKGFVASLYRNGTIERNESVLLSQE